MGLDSRRGAVSLGLTVLIVIVIALVVLIVLSNALRTYLIGGFNYFAKLITGASSGSNGSGIGGTATTRFIAFSCVTTPCAVFPSSYNYTWAVDYNGQNLSENVSTPLIFTDIQGNYSYTAYDINESGDFLCSNISYNSGHETAGEAKIIYYFNCK